MAADERDAVGLNGIGEDAARGERVLRAGEDQLRIHDNLQSVYVVRMQEKGRRGRV